MALNQNIGGVNANSINPENPIPGQPGTYSGDGTNFIELGNPQGSNNGSKAYNPLNGNLLSREQILANRNPEGTQSPNAIDMYQSESPNITSENRKNVYNNQARIDIDGNHQSFPGSDDNPSSTAWKLFGTNILDWGRADYDEVIVPITNPNS
jgi:hypothetical protein